ncbi:MAG: alanine--tRNA ligase [Planctomycetota bacterium]|nr:alanine--tRNA ligase [Planctomycetota bacterium]
MPPSATDIRRQFIEFFTEQCGHTEVPSSPVIPHDDPTLLFTNAGMNQFKDVFLGRGSRPYDRAVDTQKCIRAGGKHNDLEDVGRDTYHHTFFEMLGNWSFGDYFKAEAIKWAWQLFTEVWEMDKKRLYVTVFAGDDSDGLEADVETESLWKELTDIDPSHITRWGRKENFWEMGDTGPCGPCSEIHYDNTPDSNGANLVNKDDPNVIELWNLVFIQYNRADGGALSPLPNKHVDTGLGLERITRILQGKNSNYDTDLWEPIFERITSLTGAPAYGGSIDNPIDIAYRVLADHARCLVVAIADGGRPGAAGREYVLRRILRRAARHAKQTLGVDGPLLCNLIPAVIETLGDAFPELIKDEKTIKKIIRNEEESFLKTLDRGLELFEQAISGGNGKSISAEDAFALHDTYGFPIDLTEVMADERGLEVDREGYDKLMGFAREASRGGDSAVEKMTLPPEIIGELNSKNIGPTNDQPKYASSSINARVEAIWNGKELVDAAVEKDNVGIVLETTPFYAEAGGQIGDTGCLKNNSCEFAISETHSFGTYILHIGQITSGKLGCGDLVEAQIDTDCRTGILSNHSGTHLLNHALRAVLGEEIQQRGSSVEKDRIRFDFSHQKAMTGEEIKEVEQLVNKAIKADLLVDTKEIPLVQAKGIRGVRAVFGEQYPDPVRVVSIGASVQELVEEPENKKWDQCSVEFCGGTHVKKCGQIECFIVVQEQALASGVRRILALTGDAAKAASEAGDDLLRKIEGLNALEGNDLAKEHDSLVQLVNEQDISQSVRQDAKQLLQKTHARVKSFRKESASAIRNSVLEQAKQLANLEDSVVIASIENGDTESMLTALDAVRSKRPDGAAMLFTTSANDGKVIIVAGVGEPLISKGLKAGDWIKEAAAVCGGGGGGRADTAQAGGKEPEKIPEAIDAARKYAKEIIQ